MSGQSEQEPLIGKGLVDVHHHLVPRAWLSGRYEAIAATNRRVSLLSEWTPERSIEEMDRNFVATAITSVTNPGIWDGDAARARALARSCNEFAADIARDFPGRFGVFAALPLPDVEGSIAETAYAFDVLHADGIGLMTNYDSKWPGDPAFAPVFDELNRRKATVYFHPTVAQCCMGLIPGVSPSVVEFPFDSTRAIVSLLATGTFTRCRDINWIFSHAGGALPMVAYRIAAIIGSNPKFAGGTPIAVLEELGRLHYDTAQAANPCSMAALLELANVSQVLFGSDYPLLGMDRGIEGLSQLELRPEDLEAIGCGNALQLFPRFAEQNAVIGKTADARNR
jgi:predicted TIM-barrel fold metal-dependent hydrolase